MQTFTFLWTEGKSRWDSRKLDLTLGPNTHQSARHYKIPLLGTLVSEVSVAEEDSEIVSSSRNSFARKCPPLLKKNACAGARAPSSADRGRASDGASPHVSEVMRTYGLYRAGLNLR